MPVQNTVGYALAETGIDLDKAWKLVSSAISMELNQACNPSKLVENAGCAERLGNLAALLDTAGWILVKQGKPELALPYLDSAYAISPRPVVALHLALVKAKRGQLDKALELYAGARQERDFNEIDAKPVREELMKQTGGESALANA